MFRFALHEKIDFLDNPKIINMTATLRVLGPLTAYVGGKKELEIEAGNTVRETLDALGILPEAVAMVSVNEELQAKDYVIQDGDVIRIMAVIGGG